VPAVRPPPDLSSSNRLGRSTCGYQALLRILGVLAAHQVEVQDRGANGQGRYAELETEIVRTRLQTDLADSEVVLGKMVFVAFVVFQLEGFGDEPDFGQSRAGLEVVGLETVDPED
jgi:hypothetical protein